MTSETSTRESWQQLLGARVREYSMVLVLVALIVLATALSQGIFLRPSNLTTFLFQASVVGVIALGQSLVIMSRGLDLSVGAVAILTAMIVGAASSQEQELLPYLGAPLALIAGLGVALAVGWFNGLASARTRIPAFIVTLATMLIATGGAYLITGGYPIYSPHEAFRALGTARLVGVPLPVIIWLGLTAAVWWFVARSKFGAKIYAVGGNERAAIRAGIAVTRVKLAVYMISGLTAGVGGMLFLARTGYAEPTAGTEWLLASIAAVVVGGIRLEGGQGSVRDMLVGVLILATLGNLMNLMLVRPQVQAGIVGGVILLAVMAHKRLSAPAS